MVLSGVATSKSTCIMLRSRALYFGCAMFEVESLRKILYKAKLIFCSAISAISTMSWARIFLSWKF
jgi:hypothetical protein